MPPHQSTGRPPLAPAWGPGHGGEEPPTAQHQEAGRGLGVARQWGHARLFGEAQPFPAFDPHYLCVRKCTTSTLDL